MTTVQDALDAIEEEIVVFGNVWESNPTLRALKLARAAILTLSKEKEETDGA